MEIRGIWITTTGSQVLDSRKNIAEAMKFIADTGFNVVFPVVWNQGSTNYPSQVMQKEFGIEIKQRFQDRDPLQELIEEAAKFDLAVIPWFEYGFISTYGENGGKIIKEKPKWAARDFEGNPLVINNFYWLNSLDSEVQEFLLSLFLEVARKYKVAGIQGDDHFLALPIEGGYDEKTVERYQREFNQPPPKPPKRGNPQDPQWQDPLWQDKQWLLQWKQWVRWRADIISNFLNRFYREIININPELVISMSPNVYPWGYENYLQDSQTWVDLGLVDLVHPQLYRKEFYVYNNAIKKLQEEQFTKEKLSLLIPAILLQQSKDTNQEQIDKEHFVVAAIKYNRSVGIQGEILFFYEDLRKNNDALANILQSSVYSQPPGNFDAKEIKKNTFTHRRINDNYTYINTAQSINFKVKFDWVQPFYEGMAAVKMGYKYGYIDKSGKLVSRLQFDNAESFTEGLALVKLNNKYGYVDKNTNWLIKPQFEEAKSFSLGLAAIKIGDKWGYIDKSGKILIAAQFDDAQSFSEDIAAVKIANKWGYIDKSGKILIAAQFDDATKFSQGFALVKVVNKLGYINKNAEFLIEPQFYEADIFSEGLAPAKVGSKWGYINQFGEFIIPQQFDFAKPFSGGIALVNIGGELRQDLEQDKVYFTGGKWGYIRKP